MLPLALADLPRPRKHYQWYYSTQEANANMHACPQGIHAFLRAYYHMKSADWRPNTPFLLQAWRVAVSPRYSQSARHGSGRQNRTAG